MKVLTCVSQLWYSALDHHLLDEASCHSSQRTGLSVNPTPGMAWWFDLTLWVPNDPLQMCQNDTFGSIFDKREKQPRWLK